MSIDNWMDKEVVVHIYSGILLSHKEEHNWVSSSELDVIEPVTQSEVSRKGKNKYILMHIYGILLYFLTFLKASYTYSEMVKKFEISDNVRY